jgi:DNA polymerase III subunit epsilon
MNSSLTPKQNAIQLAARILTEKPVFLDTETTGLEKTDEIVEISIISIDGGLLYESLVKPTQSIPADANRIHNITNEMVASAPTWPVVWSQARGFLLGHPAGIYNAEFDLRLIQQSFSRYRLFLKDNLKNYCIMKLYAQFYGEWDPVRRSYRYQSLENARRQCHINLPNSHRAGDDARLALEILKYISEVKL